MKRDTGNDWVLDVPETEKGKPMFALYTGTETAEEKKLQEMFLMMTGMLFLKNLEKNYF